MLNLSSYPNANKKYANFKYKSIRKFLTTN